MGNRYWTGRHAFFRGCCWIIVEFSVLRGLLLLRSKLLLLSPAPIQTNIRGGDQILSQGLFCAIKTAHGQQKANRVPSEKRRIAIWERRLTHGIVDLHIS